MPKRKAFTLVELLVVVAIVATLVSILLPSLGEARRKSKATICASNQHQIGIALLGYATDDHLKLPYLGPWFATQQMLYVMYEPLNAATTPDGFQNLGLLQPGGYVGINSDVLFCPLLRVEGQSNSKGVSSHQNGLPSSISINTMLPADLAKYRWTNLRSGYHRRRFNESTWSAQLRLSALGQKSLVADLPAVKDFYDLNDHFGKVNVLYADGSVKRGSIDRAVLPTASYSTANNGIFASIWNEFDQ